jgi:ATP-dependent RNA helicase DeaD
MDGLDVGGLIGLVCDFGEITKAEIGRIDLKGAYSFFELEKKYTDQVMKGFDGVEVRGRKVRLELTGPQRDRDSDERGERKERSSYGGKKSGGGGNYGGARGGRSGGGYRSSGGGDRDRRKKY